MVGAETSGPFPAEGPPSAINAGWRYFQEESILKRPCHPLIGIGGVCEGFVFRSGCGELKIDFVIPWVRVTLEALQSPLAPLSPLSGSAAAVEVDGGWAACFREYPEGNVHPVSCWTRTLRPEVNGGIQACSQPHLSEFEEPSAGQLTEGATGSLETVQIDSSQKARDESKLQGQRLRVKAAESCALLDREGRKVP